jgi:hypothetical protein
LQVVVQPPQRRATQQGGQQAEYAQHS